MFPLLSGNFLIASGRCTWFCMGKDLGGRFPNMAGTERFHVGKTEPRAGKQAGLGRVFSDLTWTCQ